MTRPYDPFHQNGMGPTGEELVPMSKEEYDELPKRYPDKAWIICCFASFECHKFVQEVENTFYPPDTDENAKFGFTLAKTGNRETNYLQDLIGTMALPLEDFPKVEELAKKYEFHLTPNVGILVMGGGEEQRWFGFPPGYNNVFCVQGGKRG